MSQVSKITAKRQEARFARGAEGGVAEHDERHLVRVGRPPQLGHRRR